MVLDFYAHQTYVKKLIFPNNIFMEVINCSWVQQVDGRRVKYHFQFEPITCSTYGGQEDEDGLHSELFDHSVVLWNARGSLRSHFWKQLTSSTVELYQIL
ncbi:hypothetical protein SLE2022_260410 [Rubroshorea leprosula]